MLNEKEISSIIEDQIKEILQDKESEINEVKRTDSLNTDLGLTSLELAQLVTTLELELNCDPFAEFVSITSVRTVNDLMKAYIDFLLKDNQGESDELDDELSKIRERFQV